MTRLLPTHIQHRHSDIVSRHELHVECSIEVVQRVAAARTANSTVRDTRSTGSLLFKHTGMSGHFTNTDTQ